MSKNIHMEYVQAKINKYYIHHKYIHDCMFNGVFCVHNEIDMCEEKKLKSFFAQVFFSVKNHML